MDAALDPSQTPSRSFTDELRQLLRLGAPIGLTAQEKAALVAFLKRPLTDTRVVNGTGPFTRPTLYTESNHQPIAFGSGTPAQGGAQPRAIAVEPPHIGNPNVTVALADGTRLRGKGRQKVEAGQRLVLDLPGGGGYGDPKTRDRDRVRTLSQHFVPIPLWIPESFFLVGLTLILMQIAVRLLRLIAVGHAEERAVTL